MQVEPCEIPFSGAPKILSLRPDHGRNEAYLGVRCNRACPVLDTGKDEGWRRDE